MNISTIGTENLDIFEVNYLEKSLKIEFSFSFSFSKEVSYFDGFDGVLLIETNSSRSIPLVPKNSRKVDERNFPALPVSTAGDSNIFANLQSIKELSTSSGNRLTQIEQLSQIAGSVRNGSLTPVASWSFEQTTITSNVVADSVGTSNGLKTEGVTAIAGVVGTALQFDGMGSRVQIADNSVLHFGADDFSISGWVKTHQIHTTDPFGVNVILDKRSHSMDLDLVRGFHLYTRQGNLGFQLADGRGYTNYEGNVFVADGNWNHIVVSIDRDNNQGGQFYLNGQSVFSFDPTDRVGSVSNKSDLFLAVRSDFLQLGSSHGSFFGSLDQFEIFDRALSATEVTNFFKLNTSTPVPLA